MGAIKTTQKIILVALMAGCVPIMYLNTLTPRLGIVTGDVSFEFLDLTIFDFTELEWEGNITEKSDTLGWEFTINGTSSKFVDLDEYLAYDVGDYVYKYVGMDAPMSTSELKDNMTLDFWLEVGLPVKEELSNSTHDLRYYNGDGSLNTTNLVDPTQQVIIPRIGIDASYRGLKVGVGGSNKQYIINKDNPVQYVHLYLSGSRESDSGLMYLFTSITQEGVLDSLLMSALGGSSEDLDIGALLNDLELRLTAYIGSAPLTLDLDMSLFGLSTVPMLDASGFGDLGTAQAEDIPIWQYNFTNQIDVFERFMSQLGIEDVEPLLEDLGLMVYDPDDDEYDYDAGKILGAINQIFDENIINNTLYTVDVETAEPWWVEDGETIQTGEAYNESRMKELALLEVGAVRNATDVSFLLDMNLVEGLINDLDFPALLTMLNETWPNSYNASQAAIIRGALDTAIFSNSSSFYHKLQDTDTLTISVDTTFFPACLDTDVLDIVNYANISNSYFMENLSVGYASNIVNIFTIMNAEGYSLADLFNALDETIPSVLTTILFGNHSMVGTLFGENYEQETKDDAITPQFSLGEGEGVDSESLVLVVIIISFVALFFLLSITKGSVKINRREFLARDDIQQNISSFNKQVESLGGKVSMQNSEALAVRAFRRDGKIEKPGDVEKRARTYVENQKLLVTLQSRASRAYVAQKFKDCIAAIEKMIEIARKLEDQTLVSNYEENLAKVVKLLRRKGIAVRTKVRTEEQKPAEELENLRMYKKDLVDLQNKASKLFAEKNWPAAKDCIKDMLAIAKKIQDPVLIRNYEANLRKIIAMEKGG
ncbi:hypothetical protein GF325_15695 [Candidatus Bathyarchaeota archaeon]|nr:hypothetical protein [Candidatus Bathyarchaeota archaeon]